MEYGEVSLKKVGGVRLSRSPGGPSFGRGPPTGISNQRGWVEKETRYYQKRTIKKTSSMGGENQKASYTEGSGCEQGSIGDVPGRVGVSVAGGPPT